MLLSIKDIDQYDENLHKDCVNFKDFILFDRNNLAIISINNSYGLIDFEGNIKVPLIYSSIVLSTVNIYSVCKDNKWGYITKNNQIVIPIEYDLTSDFLDNLCAAKKNGKWGFIDLLNIAVIPFVYDGCTDFKDGVAGVMLDKKWGIIDKKNNLLLDFNYQYITPVNKEIYTFGVVTDIKVNKPEILAYFPYFLSEEYFLIHFGLINFEGEILIPAISELPILETYNGNPIVRINYQQGYLQNNNQFIPFEQFKIDPYEEKILKQLGVMKK